MNKFNYSVRTKIFRNDGYSIEANSIFENFKFSEILNFLTQRGVMNLN